jgi:DNA adenine methylase
VSARPFLKWVGGKRQLLAPLAAGLPASFGDYHEPFVGGGALFFHLVSAGRIRRAHLADANERLVRTWRGVRGDVEKVIALLGAYAHNHADNPECCHSETRAANPDTGSDAAVAAWFIYLNRTSFNGLYRVNRDGMFNVPWNRAERFTLDADNLRACAAALQSAEIRIEDFSACRRAKKGDLVYFDPPYIPATVTASFTAYTAGGFDDVDQCRLRDLARGLGERGVHVVASNSDTTGARALYADGFALEEVTARRAVNRDATKRGPVGELLIRFRGERRVLLADELGRGA